MNKTGLQLSILKSRLENIQNELRKKYEEELKANLGQIIWIHDSTRCITVKAVLKYAHPEYCVEIADLNGQQCWVNLIFDKIESISYDSTGPLNVWL